MTTPIEPNPTEQLDPLLVQLIRSVVQTGWSALIGLAVIADFIALTGLDTDIAQGLAVAIAMGLVLIASRYLTKIHPVFGWLLNGVHRKVDYALAA